MQSDGRRDEHNPRLCYEIGSDKEGSNTWSPQPFEGPGGKRGGTWSVTQLPSHGVLTVVFTQRQAVLWGGARHTTHAQTENQKNGEASHPKHLWSPSSSAPRQSHPPRKIGRNPPSGMRPLCWEASATPVPARGDGRVWQRKLPQGKIKHPDGLKPPN